MHFGTALLVSRPDNLGMFITSPGDVILRASIGGTFQVLDASSLARVAGPFSLQAALSYAQQRGSPHIFQQAVDQRGRLMGDPTRLQTPT